MKKLKKLLLSLKKLDGNGNKDQIIKTICSEFNLVKDGSVFYCDEFSCRFSYSSSNSFSNTVLSLSRLQKFDDIPFLVILVTPDENKVFLANTTFLSKISHSSHALTMNNIRGSFNGSDIIKSYQGIANNRENLEELYAFHNEVGFGENLARLVEATNNISPSGSKFDVTDKARDLILNSVKRAKEFNESADFWELKNDLDQRVEKFRSQILIASHIENVNLRGRLIEYLVTEEDDETKASIVSEIHEEYDRLPKFKTANELGDYQRRFNTVITETDIKTKIVILNSNPKAYNVDKMLQFLSKEGTVLLFYFIGIDAEKIVNTLLISVFQKDLLNDTTQLMHWSGRNSRGATQFIGKTIDGLLKEPNHEIDEESSRVFLQGLIDS